MKNLTSVLKLALLLVCVSCASPVAIHQYIHDGRYEEAKALIPTTKENINFQDYTSTTPLQYAVITDRLDIVKDLVEHGADVNYLHEDPKSSIPMTPLMLAAEAGKLENVKYLIEKGAKLETENPIGLTAVSFAGLNGHTNVAHYLLDKGAKISKKEAMSIPEVTRCDQEAAHQDGWMYHEVAIGFTRSPLRKEQYRTRYCCHLTQYSQGIKPEEYSDFPDTFACYNNWPHTAECKDETCIKYREAWGRGWKANTPAYVGFITGGGAGAFQNAIQASGGHIGNALQTTAKDNLLNGPASTNSRGPASVESPPVKIAEGCPAWAPYSKGDYCFHKEN